MRFVLAIVAMLPCGAFARGCYGASCNDVVMLLKLLFFFGAFVALPAFLMFVVVNLIKDWFNRWLDRRDARRAAEKKLRSTRVR
jgi:hypothetical protein